MKTSLLTVLGLALALGSSTKADPVNFNSGSNSGPGPFIGLQGGAFSLNSMSPSAGAMSVDIKYKAGSAFAVPLGYDFGNGFNFVFSAGRYSSSFDSVTGKYGGASQGASTRGTATFIPLMANASFKFKITDKLKWFIGAGVGAVHEDVSFGAFDYPANKSIIFGQLGPRGNQPLVAFDGLSNKEWDLGFTAFTGLAYDITPSLSLELSYRYLQLGGKASINGIGGVINGEHGSSSSFQGQAAELGLSYKY